MQTIIDFITNPFLVTAIGSWLIAQVLKTIIYAVINKEVSIERLFGDGGMPSGHSATVTSLAMMCAFICGVGSAEFAISAVLAIIVCHDAMGVRRETGKQAIMINELIKAFEDLSKEDLPEVKLKEFVGHTPIQVTAGVIIGVLNSIFMYFVLV